MTILLFMGYEIKKLLFLAALIAMPATLTVGSPIERKGNTSSSDNSTSSTTLNTYRFEYPDFIQIVGGDKTVTYRMVNRLKATDEEQLEVCGQKENCSIDHTPILIVYTDDEIELQKMSNLSETESKKGFDIALSEAASWGAVEFLNDGTIQRRNQNAIMVEVNSKTEFKSAIETFIEAVGQLSELDGRASLVLVSNGEMGRIVFNIKNSVGEAGVNRHGEYKSFLKFNDEAYIDSYELKSWANSNPSIRFSYAKLIVPFAGFPRPNKDNNIAQAIVESFRVEGVEAPLAKLAYKEIRPDRTLIQIYPRKTKSGKSKWGIFRNYYANNKILHPPYFEQWGKEYCNVIVRHFSDKGKKCDPYGYSVTIFNIDPTPNDQIAEYKSIEDTNNHYKIKVGHTWIALNKSENGQSFSEKSENFGWGAEDDQDPSQSISVPGKILKSFSANKSSRYIKTELTIPISQSQFQDIKFWWNSILTDNGDYSFTPDLQNNSVTNQGTGNMIQYGSNNTAKYAVDVSPTYCTKAVLDSLNFVDVFTEDQKQILNRIYTKWDDQISNRPPSSPNLDDLMNRIIDLRAPSPNGIDSRLKEIKKAMEDDDSYFW